jgi:hypothetical protein
MTIDAFTNLYALFPLLFCIWNPQYLRHCVGRCRTLKVFAIWCKLLPSLMSFPDRFHAMCFAFPFFVGLATFCFNFLYIFVIALHNIIHFSLTACLICIDWKRDLWQRCRPLPMMYPGALMLMSRHLL